MDVILLERVEKLGRIGDVVSVKPGFARNFLLPRGKWKVKGEKVDPAAIRKTALMSIEGELDDISGPGQTAAAHAMCTGIPKAKHRHLTVEGAGHYGIFSGRRWREVVYPQVRDFIAKYAA